MQRAADLTREYVAGGSGYVASGVPLALPAAFDDVARDFGAKVYEAMLTDPIVAGSLLTLKLGILSGGIQLIPALRPCPETSKEDTSDQKLALDVTDFCRRSIGRLRSFKATLLGLLDAMAYGAKLAEKTYELAKEGPDRGKLILKSLKVKPHDSWQFVVDRSMEVQGILVRLEDGTRTILPRDKFLIHAWSPRDNDPRGQSILRQAYAAWNLKLQTWPQYYKYLRQFASSSLLGKTAPDEADRLPVDELGAPIPGGAPISPQQFMATQLAKFQNGSVLVVPAGAEVSPIHPQGDGTAFLKAFELFNQEIVHAILMQTRATREAQFGSKADSEQGQDILGLLIGYGREALAGSLRDDLLHGLVSINYGAEIADRFTPLVSFSQTEPQDQADRWNAVSNLKRSGYLAPSQMTELDAMLGLPVRDEASDAAR